MNGEHGPIVTTLLVHYQDSQKCEHIGEAIFDIPFIIQSHAANMKKILGAL